MVRAFFACIACTVCTVIASYEKLGKKGASVAGRTEDAVTSSVRNKVLRRAMFADSERLLES